MNDVNKELRKQAALLLKVLGVMIVLPGFLITAALAIFVPPTNDGKYASAFVSLILFVIFFALLQDEIFAFIRRLFGKKS
jgi:hypothetical protein